MAEFETVDYSKLQTLNLALTNYFAHSLPNGKLYKNTISELAVFLAPYVESVGASGFIEVNTNELPNSLILNGFSIVGEGVYTHESDPPINATGVLNILSYNSGVWSLVKAIDIDITNYVKLAMGDFTDMFTSGAIPITGPETDSSPVWIKSDFIPVKEGDVIDLFCKVTPDIALVSYYTDDIASSRITSLDVSATTGPGAVKLSYTTPSGEGINFLRVCYDNGQYEFMYKPYAHLLPVNTENIYTLQEKVNTDAVKTAFKGFLNYPKQYESVMLPVEYIKVWVNKAYSGKNVQLGIVTWDGSSVVFGVFIDNNNIGQINIPAPTKPTGRQHYKGKSTVNADVYYDIYFNWDNYISPFINISSGIFVDYDIIGGSNYTANFDLNNIKYNYQNPQLFSGAIPVTGAETDSDLVWRKTDFLNCVDGDVIYILGYVTPDIKAVTFYSNKYKTTEVSFIPGNGLFSNREIIVPSGLGITHCRVCLDYGGGIPTYTPIITIRAAISFPSVDKKIKEVTRTRQTEIEVKADDWVFEDGFNCNRLYVSGISKDSVVSVTPLSEYFDALLDSLFASETFAEDGYVKIYAIVKPTINFRALLNIQ